MADAKETIIKSALKYLVKMQIEQGSVGFAVDNDHDHDCCWDDVLAWIEVQSNSNEFFNFDAPMVKKSDAVSREEVQDLISRWLSDYLLDETREALETINYKVGDMPSVTPRRDLAETSQDCISRKAVIRLVEQYPNIIGNRCSGLIADIKHLPSVTPKYTDEEIDKAQAVEQAYVDKMVELAVEESKRPKGKWIKVITNVDEWGETWHFKCSICGEKSNKGYRPLENYCHNCGAEMSGGEEDEVNN